jgi:hypothetical protein
MGQTQQQQKNINNWRRIEVCRGKRQHKAAHIYHGSLIQQQRPVFALQMTQSQFLRLKHFTVVMIKGQITSPSRLRVETGFAFVAVLAMQQQHAAKKWRGRERTSASIVANEGLSAAFPAISLVKKILLRQKTSS